jgi:hypothetical protein
MGSIDKNLKELCMSEYQPGDYNRAGYLSFMFCMAFTMTFFVYIAFFHPGVDLKELKIPEAVKEKAVEPPTAETPAAPAQ